MVEESSSVQLHPERPPAWQGQTREIRSTGDHQSSTPPSRQRQAQQRSELRGISAASGPQPMLGNLLTFLAQMGGVNSTEPVGIASHG